MFGNSNDKVHQISQKRKIGPTHRSVSGFYAFRGETSIDFESTLERDFLIRCEFFQHILDVIPQPVQIPFKTSNGTPCIYTPDFLVYYRLAKDHVGDYPKPMLVEVKPALDWQTNARKWMSKWKAAHRYAMENGWTFHIYDESRIRDKTLKNIRFLERFKRMSFDHEDSLSVLETVKKMGTTPFHFLLSKHFAGIYRNIGICHLWHLLATRKLECDISRSLNDFTEFWVPAL